MSKIPKEVFNIFVCSKCGRKALECTCKEDKNGRT